MILRGKGKPVNIKDETIGRLAIDKNTTSTYRVEYDTITENKLIVCSEDYYQNHDKIHNERALILSTSTISHFNNSDIVRINPNGFFEILYSKLSNDNSLFITEKCNSKCIFCPQPPKNTDDLEYLFNSNNKLISYLPEDIEYLGITGGEPLIAREYLFELLKNINLKLPNTEIQILTNRKLLGNREYFDELSELINPNYIFAIPLYSDYEGDHDILVGSSDAFIKTIKGLYNLASIGCRIELRIVLNKTTLSRLNKLSKFIFKNLPFVEHVAFMGLEITGYANKNFDKIWDYDQDYKTILKDSLLYLSNWGIPCSIYNIPLCCIPPEIREFSAKSISDWKQNYSSECDSCDLKPECGGFFNTSKKNIYHISAFTKN
jgi:His-Xaa-Ser system radical SAM maturase HxsC